MFKSLLIAYIALIFFVSFSTCNPSTTGFTIDLIHRDSPQSPWYDPSLTPRQRLANAVQRSFNRLQRFKSSTPSKLQTPNTDIINAGGEYLMSYSVGTPPLPSLGIADTGSDLIWTQCQLCQKCFNQSLPIFQPKKSSTYKKIPCNTPNCRIFQGTFCSKRVGNCLYSERYADTSSTTGELATDTITLGKMVSVPNVTFGCGFRNNVVFSGGESGIVGLGGGKASLIRQLGPLAQGKFSYCLVSLSDDKNSSKLNFGSNAEVSGRGVVSTPLVKKNPETFYVLSMEGISVGNQRLEMLSQDSSAQSEGNIIIDSGTTLTLLPNDLYFKVENALKSSIKLRQIPDPLGVLDLCYFSRKDNIQIPDITVHFKGADVKLSQDNVFVRPSADALCFAAKPVQDGGAIYGNVAQINFLVGYDLQKRTVSFKPTHCAE